MKLLCASNSVAFAQSLRIALDAEGIETYCSEPDLALASIAGPVAGGGNIAAAIASARDRSGACWADAPHSHLAGGCPRRAGYGAAGDGVVAAMSLRDSFVAISYFRRRRFDTNSRFAMRSIGDFA
jgi:hypothetical protein